MHALHWAEIVANKVIVPGFWLIDMLAPAIAEEAQPGQFLHIRCSEGNDPLLRRPLSIHYADQKTGHVGVLYQEAGEGTMWLSKRNNGLLDVLGPLGRGFTLPTEKQRLVLVGGGIGIAPLFFLLRELSAAGYASDTTLFLGARNVQQLFIEKDAQKLGFTVRSATDDGSTGYHGLVTDLLAEALQQETGKKPDFVYACGPSPMLEKVCSILNEAETAGEVSLEERMGCGVGACLSCVCKTKGEESFAYRRVCVEGPVFKAKEVIW